MKRFSMPFVIIFISLFSLLSAACNSESVSSPTAVGLQIEVHLEKRKYCINENIQVVVSLINSGRTDVLIDGHWALTPILMPPGMSSGALLISEISGEELPAGVKIDRFPVQEGDFVRLASGKVITKVVELYDRHYGDSDNYYSYLFEQGKTYILTAIYQNDLAFSRMIDNEEVASWTGEISGSGDFQIDSKSCKGE